MIYVGDVVADPELAAPEPFQVLRSTQGSAFVSGGFESITTTITMVGPVQQASNAELNMVPEADRVGSTRSFWCLQPIYLTRGYAPVPSVLTQTPQGAIPGTVYTLLTAPSGVLGTLIKNGLFLTPGLQYDLVGTVITLYTPTEVGDVLLFTSPITVNVQPEASDIIVYPPGGERFRVLAKYFDPGSGYWKAIGTRLEAA